jgi:hypothetical protein
MTNNKDNKNNGLGTKKLLLLALTIIVEELYRGDTETFESLKNEGIILYQHLIKNKHSELFSTTKTGKAVAAGSYLLAVWNYIVLRILEYTKRVISYVKPKIFSFLMWLIKPIVKRVSTLVYLIHGMFL